MSHRLDIPGEGPLDYGRVLRQAWAMFGRHYRRVALVALLLFVPPQVLLVALTDVRRSLEADATLAPGLGYVIGLLGMLLMRLFGPVIYAGYLDEAVGQQYFQGRYRRFESVIRTLPWGTLVVADVILVVGAVVGLSLLVLPGIAWLTLFTLVGPVIVQERHGVIDGFRRTYQLSRVEWRRVLLLVVTLLVVEGVVHEIVHQAFHHSAVWLAILASWAVSAFVGGVVGLVEVALATELMARTPRSSPGTRFEGSR